jgi:hypothetical protein
MYDARAYVHWYRRYGVAEPQFERAFAALGAIIAAYSR